MRQSAAMHQMNARAFLTGVIRALLFAASDVLGLEVDKNAAISVEFDDTYFTDTESVRARDLRELEAGVLTAEEYRRKWIEGGENG